MSDNTTVANDRKKRRRKWVKELDRNELFGLANMDRGGDWSRLSSVSLSHCSPENKPLEKRSTSISNTIPRMNGLCLARCMRFTSLNRTQMNINEHNLHSTRWPKKAVRPVCLICMTLALTEKKVNRRCPADWNSPHAPLHGAATCF